MDFTKVLFLLLVSAAPHILAYNAYRRERAGLTRVPELIDKTITSLHLNLNLITGIEENAFLGFDQLAYIFLRSNMITVIPDSAFNGTRLKLLNIDSNRLTTLPNLAVVGSTLRTLSAKNNQIERADGLRHLPALTLLNLQNNKMTSIAPDVLTGISAPLDSLYISNNRLTDIDFLGSPNLSYNNRISYLNLDGNFMGELPTNAFDRLITVMTLRMVATGLTEIPDFIHQKTNLRYLYLSWNLITAIRKDAFDGFNLAQLHLDNNRLVDVSSLFHPLISITTLYLNDNNIGPIDISHMNRPITGLTSLSLKNNNLRAMPCDDMMRFLELLPRLTTLYMQATGLETFPDISVLNHRLKRLEILNPRTMHCDCSLVWMRNITQMVTYTDIAAASRPCGSPRKLVGFEWNQVTEEDLCQGEDVTSCGRHNRNLSRPLPTLFTEQTTPSIEHTMSTEGHATPSTEQSTLPTEKSTNTPRRIGQSEFPWIAVKAEVLGLLLLTMIVVALVLLVRRKSPTSQVKAGKMQEDNSSPNARPSYLGLERRTPSHIYDEIPPMRNK